MKVVHWVLAGVIILPCLWVILASTAPFFLNGYIYKIEAPVQVIEVTDMVRLRFTRQARLDMPGTCSREIVCSDQVYLLPSDSCPIQRGTVTLSVTFPIPVTASGECVVQGLVSYAPIGRWGPDLSHAWKSETFTIERKESVQ